jgi:predicted restriction endonuclease
MCDLLDAAACLSGTPLLALVKVLAKSGEINPKAFKEDVGLRDFIIKKSLAYRFRKSDYFAISQGLTKLEDKGNRNAWQYVYKLFSREQIIRRLAGTGPIDDPALNAVDDIGTDKPDRALSQVWLYTRDQAVRNAVLKRANGICEYCGKTGFLKSDGKPYLESHHVIALADDGEDRTTNVIALCPNDHREAHFGAKREEIESEMIQILKRIA